MYPPKFDYYRAHSVAEAVSLLGQHRGAKLIAGGHSLLPAMKLRLADPGVLIDIGRIAELKGITTLRDGSARIGALTTHAAIAASPDVPRVLSEAAGLVGDPQVRNRGTIGGNVAHADPASDMPTVLVALNATFNITGPAGDRSVAAADFFTGLFETALAEGEVLTSIVIRTPQPAVPISVAAKGSAYTKLFNPASRYAMVGAAAVVMADNGTCTAASVAVGGLTPYAMKAPSVEAALLGKALDAATIAAAAEAVQNDLGEDILGDIHASTDYRRAMATVFVRRAVTAAAERAE